MHLANQIKQILGQIPSKDELTEPELEHWKYDLREILATKGTAHFLYMERFLAVVKAVHKFVPKGNTIADIGCGRGNHAIQLSKAGYHVIGVDIRHSHLKYAGRKMQINEANFIRVQADLGLLPFPNNVFDAVICSSVIEFYYEPEKALLEIHQVLKPSGILILSTRNGSRILRSSSLDFSSFSRERTKGNIPHRYAPREWSFRLTKSELKSLLFLSGFDILDISASVFMGMYPFSGIIPYSLIRILRTDKLLKLPLISRFFAEEIVAVARPSKDRPQDITKKQV